MIIGFCIGICIGVALGFRNGMKVAALATAELIKDGTLVPRSKLEDRA